MIKTYIVKIPVYETIEIEVRAENEQEANFKAIEKAIEEQPKVCWMVDDDRETEINEVLE